jgi:ABC-type branched-subunit amino acid transport system permease subunit
VFICDVATVGATVHAWHVALHLGLVGLVSVGGGFFLTLGAIAHRRALRARQPTSEPRRQR